MLDRFFNRKTNRFYPTGAMALYCYMLLLTWAASVPAGVLYAQYENIWAFGSGAGFNFNSGGPVYFPTGIQADEGCASVCDAQGQLLFYTEGYNVWNREHQLMPNGKELLGSIDRFSFNPTSSTTQGALIVPMPDSAGKYYVFSLTSYEVNPAREANKLYYSVVNMALNGGSGDVEPGRKGILWDSLLTEMMTAVTGDRCNIWLLVAQHYDNTLKAYNITASGLDRQAVVSNLLPANRGFFQGYIEMSPNRRAMAINRIGLGLYDFDPASGRALGKANLVMVKTPEAGHGGVAFSPDNTKLYASVRDTVNQYHLYQFDLSSGDSARMVSSKFSLGHYFMQAMKRAPDGRIYACDLGQGMGLVAQPNQAGNACQFAAVGQIGGQNWVSVFPNTIALVHKEEYPSSSILSGNCFANVRPGRMAALDDSSGWDYVWNDGRRGPYREADSMGLFWLQYTTPPCQAHIDTFRVFFPYGVLPSFQVQAGCRGQHNGRAFAHTYPGDTVTYHYQWYNATGNIRSDNDTLYDAAPGDYRVHIRTAHCDTTVTLVIPEEQHRVAFHSDSIVCTGDTLHFTNTSSDHYTRFQWHFGEGTVSAQANPIHAFALAGIYRVQLIAGGAVCQDTFYKDITVDPIIAPVFKAMPDSICQGTAVSFYHATHDLSLNLLRWDFGDGVAADISDTILTHAYALAGQMPVSLNAQFRACPDQIYIDTVKVFALPQVDLSPDSSLCLDDGPVVLSNRAAATHYRYLWNTGAVTPVLIVTQPGKYGLTVSDTQRGCSATETVTIKKGCYTDIPNIFSPNGDGHNDYFYPRQHLSSGISSYALKIYNRWGQTVFESQATNGKGWDGRCQGKEQPAGTYIYQLEWTSGARREQYQGNIMLIR